MLTLSIPLYFEVMYEIDDKIGGVAAALFEVCGSHVPVAILPGARPEPGLQHR